MIGTALQDQYNRFLHLKKTHSTEESLKIIAKSMRGCWFTRLLKEIYFEYPEIKDIQDKIQNYDISFLSQYFQGNTHQCSVCGRECLKIHDTCSRKCQAKSQKVREKRKQTCLERFGTENAYQSEQIKEKIKQKNLERRGVEYPSQSKECIQKRKENNIIKYGVDSPSKLDSVKEKGIQSCLERFGRRSNMHMHITNYDNYNDEYIMNNFVHNGIFDCLAFEQYFNLTRKESYLTIKRLGVTYNKRVFSLIQHSLFESIDVQNKLENDRTIINPLELDIVLPDYKLAIEYNGIYWHSSDKKDKMYHFNKSNMCREHGYTLFHTFESENIDIWKAYIDRFIKNCVIIDASHCEKHEITNKDANSFYKLNHIEGFPNGFNISKNIALINDGKIIQCISLSNNKIIRNCTLNGYYITDGLKLLISDLHNISIKANLRYEDLREYENCGFIKTNFIKPKEITISGTKVYDCGYLEYKYIN